MKSLAEIEAAVEALPRAQQEELFAYLAERIRSSRSYPTDGEDAFARIIGAFAGPHEATGRRAEDVLYGHGQ